MHTLRYVRAYVKRLPPLLLGLSVLRCGAELPPAPCSTEAPAPSVAETPSLVLAGAATEGAIDVLFVAEGYREGDLPRFTRSVDALIAGVRADAEGIVGRAPARFNFHRLDSVSATNEVPDADRSDTAWGGCLQPDAPGFSADWLSSST